MLINETYRGEVFSAEVGASGIKSGFRIIEGKINPSGMLETVSRIRGTCGSLEETVGPLELTTIDFTMDRSPVVAAATTVAT